MLIRRLSITLPARMRAGAEHDARALAEAIAGELAARGQTPHERLSVSLPDTGLTGAALARTLAATLPKGGRHGG